MAATIVTQELAVRAVIATVAADGSMLVKVNSPGKLYKESLLFQDDTGVISQHNGTGDNSTYYIYNTVDHGYSNLQFRNDDNKYAQVILNGSDVGGSVLGLPSDSLMSICSSTNIAYAAGAGGSHVFGEGGNIRFSVLSTGVAVGGTLCSITAGTIPMGSVTVGLADSVMVQASSAIGVGVSPYYQKFKLEVYGNGFAVGTATRQTVYIEENNISSGYNSTANDYTLGLNYSSYSGANAYFRDTIIYDGKNNALVTVDGSAGTVTIGGALDLGGIISVDHIAEKTGNHKIVCDSAVQMSAVANLIGDYNATYPPTHLLTLYKSAAATDLSMQCDSGQQCHIYFGLPAYPVSAGYITFNQTDGVMSMPNLTVVGGLACNGATAQTPYVLGAAASDAGTTQTLANNLRLMAIAFGFGVTA